MTRPAVGWRRARDRAAEALPAPLARWLHWEFWPAWAAYLPLTPYIAWLFLRHGATTMMLANDHPDLAALAGESKWGIMRHIPPPWGVATVLIPPGERAARLRLLTGVMTDQRWSWPIILKPDVGCRGAGFRVVRDMASAELALDLHPQGSLAQPFHPGPHEAGVFYVRESDDRAGRIFSVTLKERPFVLGDGASSIEQLIVADPRRRLQAGVFLARLGGEARRVPSRGEVVTIGQAGNHAQGAVFRDGAACITPALEARIEDIARGVPGFRFGRFDVRYADREAFIAGRDFAVVELNGVSSESTNVYDPDMPIGRAYATMARVLGLAYELGSSARRAGQRPPPFWPTLRALWRWYREPVTTTIAD